MPNKEHERAEKKRDGNDKKTSIIVFSIMAVSLLASLTYIFING